MAKIVVAFLCLAAWPLGVAPGATWYVDGSVPESGDGTSWDTAFRTVGEAILAAADHDTLIVAPGVYRLMGEPPADAAMRAAGASAEQPPRAGFLVGGKGLTLRSVDPLSPAVVSRTILDGGGSGHVIWFSSDETETTSISGFTIRNGKSYTSGGGIDGGTKEHHHPYVVIENNIICNNTAGEGGGAIAYCDGIIRNNIIMSNLAMGYYNNFGGALYDCDGIIEGNIIAGNCATGIEWTGGGAGGGLADCDGIIRDNVIMGNSAPWSIGGGLYHCHGTILNNAIVDNEATDGGGLYSCKGTITNNIVWGNHTDPYGRPDFSWSSQPTYCCIQDWTGGGEGNIDLEPRFVDEAKADYRLRADSPCIDAGFNSPDLPETHIAGMPRIMYGGKSLTVDMGAYEFFYTGVQRGPGPDEATLVWSFVPDKTYSIFYTDDLFNWHIAIANFPSSGNQTTSWTDDGSLTGLPPLLAPKRFYRLLENP